MTLPKITPPPAASAPEGDGRGPYGYGRPAHGSDSTARYRFAPNETILPTTTAERIFHPPASGDEIEQSASAAPPRVGAGQSIAPETEEGAGS